MEWTMIVSLIGFSYFMYMIISTALRPMVIVKERMKHIDDVYGSSVLTLEEDIRKRAFKERVINPVLERMSSEIYKRTPRGRMNDLERKLEIGGYPYGLSIAGWIAVSAVISWLLPICFIFFISKSANSDLNKIIMSIVIFGVFYFLPNFMLNQKITERKIVLSRQLPDILDLMTVSVEAGLSFDSAMAKVSEKGTNELSREFGKVVTEMQMGISRREALKNMVDRCDTDDVRLFLSTVIQAEQLGISLGKVLRSQSAQMRVKRRQRAEEQAMKAPVKMIVPIVFFIFPSIFVVILGPAIIQIKNILVGP